MSTPSPKYKVAFLGDSRVGKTAFIHRHRTGEYLRDYIPTLELEIHPLSFYTSSALTVMNVWDISGMVGPSRNPDSRLASYLEGADAVVVMVDVIEDSRLIE